MEVESFDEVETEFCRLASPEEGGLDESEVGRGNELEGCLTQSRRELRERVEQRYQLRRVAVDVLLFCLLFLVD